MLRNVLKGPKALKQFIYDEYFTPCPWKYEDSRSYDYLEALLDHKDSLQGIRLHLWKFSRGEPGSPGFKLGSFSNLKSLSIDMNTLFGDTLLNRESWLGSWFGINTFFPSRLEELNLRTFVDTTDVHQMSVKYGDLWLSTIALETPAALPRLQKFSVEESREANQQISARLQLQRPIMLSRPDFWRIGKMFQSIGIQFEHKIFTG